MSAELALTPAPRLDDRDELAALGVLVYGAREREDGWRLVSADVLARWTGAPHVSRLVAAIRLEVPGTNRRRLRVVLVSSSSHGTRPLILNFRANELHALDRAMRAAIGAGIEWDVMRPEDGGER